MVPIGSVDGLPKSLACRHDELQCSETEDPRRDCSKVTIRTKADFPASTKNCGIGSAASESLQSFTVSSELAIKN